MAFPGMKALRASKFTLDLLWNYAAMAVLGVGGIAVNLIIAGYYGAEDLGVFNQIYAVYVVTAHFAVGGVHYSALKHVADHAADPQMRAKVVWAALVVSGALGLAATVTVLALSAFIGEVMESQSVGEGMPLAALGLVFFAVNKVLLATLNGLRRMAAFAVGNALRMVFIVGFVVVALAMGLPGHALAAAFTVAEVGLVLLLSSYVFRVVGLTVARGLGAWVKVHAKFGAKAFLGGVFLEINPRVDVLMIGFFMSDRAVGVYSFAAMLAEGILSLIAVVRNNVNPILVPLLAEGRRADIQALARRVRRFLCPSVLAGTAVILALYPFVVRATFGEAPFMESWPVLAVLVAGIIVYSAYLPFDAILSQAGLPGRQTALNALVLGTNIVLNAALIPVFGVLGAATATATAFLAQMAGLRFMARRHVSVRL